MRPGALLVDTWNSFKVNQIYPFATAGDSSYPRIVQVLIYNARSKLLDSYALVGSCYDTILSEPQGPDLTSNSLVDSLPIPEDGLASV